MILAKLPRLILLSRIRPKRKFEKHVYVIDTMSDPETETKEAHVSYYDSVQEILSRKTTPHPNEIDMTFCRAIVTQTPVPLFPYQLADIDAIASLEAHSHFIHDGKRVLYNSCCLSEPFGAGKTFIVIGLITQARKPIPRPFFLENTLSREMEYIPRDRLTPTMIFTARSVLDQWKRSLLASRVSLFIVDDVESLRKFATACQPGPNGERLINKFDAVLIKCGYTYVRTGLLKLTEETSQQNPLHATISHYLREHSLQVSRVVYDDFDTLANSTITANTIPADSTIYVSSTLGLKTSVKSTKPIKDWGGAGIVDDKFLGKFLRICSTEAFRRLSYEVPKCRFYVTNFSRLMDSAISGMLAIGTEEAKALYEMVNAGALEDAAQVLGNKCVTPEAVVATLIGKQVAPYEEARDLVDFMSMLLVDVYPKLPSNDIRLDDEEKRELRAEIRKFNTEFFEQLESKRGDTESYITAFRKEQIEIRDKLKIVVTRVKESLQEGSCVICCQDFKDSGLSCSIMRCCGICLCSGCVRQTGTILNDKSLSGQCPNCFGKITIKDIIIVDDKVNLKDIAETKVEEIDFDEVPANARQSVKDSEEQSKEMAVYKIIAGEKVHGQNRVDMHISRMLTGRKILPDAKKRKVLVFSNHASSFESIQKLLTERGIKWFCLSGVTSVLNKIVLDFENEPTNCALFVNSSQYCAGLNLQFATDIVYLHHMLDQTIREQVIGRGQRIGRSSNLNVHFLLYGSEKAEMTAHNIIHPYSGVDEIPPAVVEDEAPAAAPSKAATKAAAKGKQAKVDTDSDDDDNEEPDDDDEIDDDSDDDEEVEIGSKPSGKKDYDKEKAVPDDVVDIVTSKAVKTPSVFAKIKK